MPGLVCRLTRVARFSPVRAPLVDSLKHLLFLLHKSLNLLSTLTFGERSHRGPAILPVRHQENKNHYSIPPFIASQGLSMCTLQRFAQEGENEPRAKSNIDKLVLSNGHSLKCTLFHIPPGGGRRMLREASNSTPKIIY